MVKKTKRVYRRRYYRKRRVLSKGNIFGRKSAKSQAKQIYAINKKINKIEKRTRPETLVYLHNNLSCYRTEFSASNTNARVGFTTQNPLISYLHSISPADLEYFHISGRMIRISDIKLYFNLRRSTHSKPFDVLGRITIIKLNKISSNRDVSWIHTTPVESDSPYSSSTISRIGNISNIVYGPLSNNVTSIGKVVYDKKFKMKGSDSAQNTLNRKVRLYGQTIRKSTIYDYPDLLQNDYIVCITAGFNPVAYDNNATLISDDILCLEVGAKITFVDESERV